MTKYHFFFLSLCVITIPLSCTRSISCEGKGINIDKSFVAKVGEKICIDAENNFTINHIDNQLCPCDVICVWEGEYILHFDVESNGKNYTYILGSSGQVNHGSPPFSNFKISFISLLPEYNCIDQHQSDYQVTLKVTK